MNETVLVIENTPNLAPVAGLIASLCVSLALYNVFLIIYSLLRRKKVGEAVDEIKTGWSNKQSGIKAADSPESGENLVEEEIKRNEKLLGEKKQEQMNDDYAVKNRKKAKTLDKKRKKANEQILKEQEREERNAPLTDEEFMTAISEMHKKLDEIEDILDNIDLDSIIVTGSAEMDEYLEEQKRKREMGSRAYKKEQKEILKKQQEEKKRQREEEKRNTRREIQRKSMEEASLFDEFDEEEDDYKDEEFEEAKPKSRKTRKNRKRAS